jgi:hypothetical protein
MYVMFHAERLEAERSEAERLEAERLEAVGGGRQRRPPAGAAANAL